MAWAAETIRDRIQNVKNPIGTDKVLEIKHIGRIFIGYAVASSMDLCVSTQKFTSKQFNLSTHREIHGFCSNLKI